MSEQSIKKLKRRFLLIAMISFVAVMLLMGGFIYILNVCLTRAEIRHVLLYIAENDGAVPDMTPVSVPGVKGRFRNPAFYQGDGEDTSDDDMAHRLEGLFRLGGGYNSPEFFYSTRYFAVLYDGSDLVEDVIVNHMASVSSETAVELATQARKRFFKFGSFGDYYYLNTARKEGGRIVVYLDSTAQIFMNNRILYIALSFLCLGSVITYLMMRVLVGRLIKPEIRNAELQKQFLTNASHELKTPLSVIRANTELMEMSGGENEWTQATLRQVDRLQGLVDHLVDFSRAQEQDSGKKRKKIDVSVIVKETAESMRSVAEQAGIRLKVDVNDKVRCSAAEEDIRQLTSLLADNAIKYCDPEGTVTVELSSSGLKNKGMDLSVSNHFADGKGVDYDRFFERFYRADESHNTEKGGYGIGLSIAEQLVKRYRGTIDVSWEDGVITFDCQLP
ncbi:MAG: HAMP domain-containing histidine kinase [Lachnospiraceae bacterium]|nr:HAMP domain-containing histidine kinase [Lachnospiraceae bacterium]